MGKNLVTTIEVLFVQISMRKETSKPVCTVITRHPNRFEYTAIATQYVVIQYVKR